MLQLYLKVLEQIDHHGGIKTAKKLEGRKGELKGCLKSIKMKNQRHCIMKFVWTQKLFWTELGINFLIKN